MWRPEALDRLTTGPHTLGRSHGRATHLRRSGRDRHAGRFAWLGRYRIVRVFGPGHLRGPAVPVSSDRRYGTGEDARCAQPPAPSGLDPGDPAGSAIPARRGSGTTSSAARTTPRSAGRRPRRPIRWSGSWACGGQPLRPAPPHMTVGLAASRSDAGRHCRPRRRGHVQHRVPQPRPGRRRRHLHPARPADRPRIHHPLPATWSAPTAPGPRSRRNSACPSKA